MGWHPRGRAESRRCSSSVAWPSAAHRRRSQMHSCRRHRRHRRGSRVTSGACVSGWGRRGVRSSWVRGTSARDHLHSRAVADPGPAADRRDGRSGCGGCASRKHFAASSASLTAPDERCSGVEIMKPLRLLARCDASPSCTYSIAVIAPLVIVEGEHAGRPAWRRRLGAADPGLVAHLQPRAMAGARSARSA